MEQHTQQQPESKAYRDFSLILLLVDLLMSGVFALRIFLTRTFFARMFEDFQITQPVIATIVLSGWYASILPILAVVGIAKEILISNRHVTLVWNGVQMAVIFMVWQFYNEGTMEPLMWIMKKLSG